MKRIWTICLLASAARAADVTLWMAGQYVVDNEVRFPAACQAGRMFDAIGVTLRWAQAAPYAPEGPAIEVRFTTGVPGHPGAMAFSTPFDAQPVITVLYDRILFVTKLRPDLRATFLAHVLAHEIGHVLMASNLHSSDGVMKAHWTESDYARMAYRPLAFPPGDSDSIRRGLAFLARARGQQEGFDGASGGGGRAK
jgi:hypothetical protein